MTLALRRHDVVQPLCGLRHVFVLPDANGRPTGCAQLGIGVHVSSAIARNLLWPVPLVRAMQSPTVFLATVPEAAIDEYIGDELDAARAQWGMVNEVVPADGLHETAVAWGRRLAAGPTTALSLIKRLLDSSHGSSFEEALEDEARSQHIVSTTSDCAEGAQAFFQRREPNFTGS
jgi:hypothetical protein